MCDYFHLSFYSVESLALRFKCNVINMWCVRRTSFLIEIEWRNVNEDEHDLFKGF